MIWRVADRELVFEKVLVMGIINATPDSFSDGGKYDKPLEAAKRAALMVSQGADVIDIGAQSTRPGAKAIDAQEEWRRLEPTLRAVVEAVDVPVSVDTFFPEVAKKAIECGASIINDVTGFSSPDMRALAAETNAGCIVTHCDDVSSRSDCVAAVRAFFEERMAQLENKGVASERLCFDCGIGFGKTRQQEIELVSRMDELRAGERPLLAAFSRKRMIAHCLPYDTEPRDRDHGTTAAHVFAILSGANILRVHNVEAAVQCAAVAEKFGCRRNFD